MGIKDKLNKADEWNELEQDVRLFDQSHHLLITTEMIMAAPDSETYVKELKGFLEDDFEEKKLSVICEIIQEAKEKIQELEE